MLMVISPAKTLDYESPLTTNSYSIPDYLENSAELVDIIDFFAISHFDDAAFKRLYLPPDIYYS